MATDTFIPEVVSAWAPLRRPLFRNLWIASLVSNLGGWMQDTAGTWLMVSLTSSPLLIALMQTAASFPVLILGLPAGAVGDIVERRRLLIFWQSWMLVAVLILSVFTFAGMISPWALLILTFMLNIGVAVNGPAWQAIIPELVPRSMVPNAVAINSAQFNLARALGPAIGGLLVAVYASTYKGAGSVFFLNSLSFLAVIWVLAQWQRSPIFKSALPAERLFGSMRSGVRYLRHSPPLRAVLIRCFSFTLAVSAVWALLAVVAQRELHQGAMGYGILNGCLGAGAVVGAVTLPKLRAKYSPDQIVFGASLMLAGTLATMAFVHFVALVVLSLIAGGFAWTSASSTFNVAVQLSAPAWVQGRAQGIYQMTFQGGMAAGSALFGYLAEHRSTRVALACAAATLLAGVLWGARYRLPHGVPPNLDPLPADRTALSLELDPKPDDGPVLVTIEYLVSAEEYDAFTRAIHKLRDVRLRDGSIRWGTYQDAAQPGRFVENFVVESWLEYLRQRERMTASDLLIREHVRSFHQGEEPPVVSHMIYARPFARPR
ncbi:MAG: MFS transporter [Candidatus Acidiferrales bacterium]